MSDYRVKVACHKIMAQCTDVYPFIIAARSRVGKTGSHATQLIVVLPSLFTSLA